MSGFAVQIIIASLSLLGLVALIPGPDKTGVLRIEGRWNRILSYTGIALLILPWLVMPFLPQPRTGSMIAAAVSFAGVLLIFTGAALYGVSLWYLVPAFRKQFTEFTPEMLVTAGPYKWVRNPVYLSLLMVLFGLDAASGAVYSIALLPLAYILFRAIAYYEERRILLPRFGESYIAYKASTPNAIFGRPGTIVFCILCWLPLTGLLF